jgi:hypothetical protein
MKFKVMKTLIPGGVFMIVGAQLLFGQQVVDNWKITPNSDGKSATMTFENPSTYLKIESDLEIAVDASGTPASGSIHFKSGFKRAMTPGETVFYFSEFNGDNVYWDFREKQGSIVSYTVGPDPVVPQNFAGQQVRAISKDGKFYIGILSLLPSSPDWFSLNIKNNSMLFYKNAVKEVQQLK